MNLQAMSIIFVIIFLPIILISTYYIQREVDTITIQNGYDTKLIDATTDAVSAFEINTANEDLSAVSDSLRSMIEASNNVFINTFASNLGMSNASKSAILPYIPAIVYTLYDGYYIYSPTKQPKVVTDNYGVYVRVGDIGVVKEGNHYIYNYKDVEDYNNSNDPLKTEPAKLEYENVKEDYHALLYYTNNEKTFDKNKMECTTKPDYAYKSTKYILKSFSPYSAHYKNNEKKIDVTINYTLDNYITIYGTVGDVYYSKSGYLIKTDNITNINIDNTYYENSFKYSDNKYIGIEEIDGLVDSANKVEITINGITITKDAQSAETEDYTGSKIKDNVSAIKYYLKAYSFSTWVNETFKDLKEDDFINEYNSKDFLIKYNIDDNVKSNENLFEEFKNNRNIFASTIDYENIDQDTTNSFYEHKRKIIKNAIQYNLNQAMAVYNQGKGDNFYQMPVLSEVEWDKLLSNISVLAFAQGLPCGLKTYNNYAIVTSKNNEIMANVDDIYYIPITSDSDGVKTSANTDDNSDLDTVHHYDCEKLYDEINGKTIKYFEAFPSREVKYDKEYNSSIRNYEYDHVCNSCYYCIVNSNYFSISKENKDNIDALDDDDEKKRLYRDNKTKIETAKLIAIGKIKNNTYKSSKVVTDYGLYIDNTPKKLEIDGDSSKLSKKLDSDKVKKCYEIEVTVENKFKKSWLNRS